MVNLSPPDSSTPSSVSLLNCIEHPVLHSFLFRHTATKELDTLPQPAALRGVQLPAVVTDLDPHGPRGLKVGVELPIDLHPSGVRDDQIPPRVAPEPKGLLGLLDGLPRGVR